MHLALVAIEVILLAVFIYFLIHFHSRSKDSSLSSKDQDNAKKMMYVFIALVILDAAVLAYSSYKMWGSSNVMSFACGCSNSSDASYGFRFY